jgi:hypothetical protein
VIKNAAFTYKELGYALYMTCRFTIEIEYNDEVSAAANDLSYRGTVVRRVRFTDRLT